MKQFVLIVSLFFFGCAIRPAPITTLDIQATLSGLHSEELRQKSDQLMDMIKGRRKELKKTRSRYDYTLISMMWSPLFAALPTYLCQKNARNEIEIEIKSMDQKEKSLLEFLELLPKQEI